MAHDDAMTTAAHSTPHRAQPLAASPPFVASGRFLLAVGLLAAGVVPALFVFPHDRISFDATLPTYAWLPVGVVGVVLLDRRPGSWLAWSAVASGVTPAVLLVHVWLTSGGDVGAVAVRDGLGSLGPVVVAPLTLVAGAAALEAFGRASVRDQRRRGIWVVATCALATAAAPTVWFVGDSRAFGITAAGGILAVATALAATGLAQRLRPVDEPVLDVALVLGTLAAATAGGALVRAFALHERIFGAEVVGGFAGVMTAIVTVPAAAWVRRAFLVRRYGVGVLEPGAVESITADLTVDSDPRLLLGKASRMVTDTTGAADARIVLDDDAETGWAAHPLEVGGERVGTLLLRPRRATGFEARHDRAVAQLLPTVALVARAVSLAVDARHARSDVVRLRDAERARVLADLHDDLGPVLAGMSMRVQAARRHDPSPALEALADDLAHARADLRRIVAGLTPGALVSGDLTTAVAELVSSFSASAVRVDLDGDVPHDIDAASAVVIYRTLAEGITNALRHARPSRVTIAIGRADAGVVATVTDDGTGGLVVPGVGLTSLAARARERGGTLLVTRGPDGGTRLTLTLAEPGEEHA